MVSRAAGWQRTAICRTVSAGVFFFCAVVHEASMADVSGLDGITPSTDWAAANRSSAVAESACATSPLYKAMAESRWFWTI